MIKVFLSSALVVFLCTQCQTKKTASEYLLMVSDTEGDRFGYIDQRGDTIIPLGRCNFCFTDTFRTYAIVHKTSGGYHAIDRNEKELYEVFNIDNGPDYVEEGYFRIIENEKIGYADAATGKIMIKPHYEAAFPFEDGKAKVAVYATSEKDGEYNIWRSGEWIYIDKKGNTVSSPE
ncbi:MAG: WG repeat-containing protein [Bacteroidota bacterium]|nr:WG repeat-containing protein [Bacteroidota bacterium]